MSTEGLKGVEALRAAIHESADDVKAQAKATDKEARRIEKQKRIDAEAAAIAARRLEQEHLDELEKLDHKAAQQAYMLTGSRPDDTPAQPAPASVPQPPVAPPAQGGDTQRQPPVPHNDPSHFVPGFEPPPQQPPAHTTVNVLNVRRWTRVQWTTAGVGLVVAFLVWLFTWHPILGAGHIHGDGRAWTALLWLVILLFTGFFGGGWIGSMIDERRAQRTNVPPVAA
jgi:hypothetical protein